MHRLPSRYHHLHAQSSLGGKSLHHSAHQKPPSHYFWANKLASLDSWYPFTSPLSYADRFWVSNSNHSSLSSTRIPSTKDNKCTQSHASRVTLIVPFPNSIERPGSSSILSWDDVYMILRVLHGYRSAFCYSISQYSFPLPCFVLIWQLNIYAHTPTIPDVSTAQRTPPSMRSS